MKTTPLPKILKQITPLPYHWVGTKRSPNLPCYLRGAGLECVGASLDGFTDNKANAAYLVHAANVLPGLVEALRESIAAMERMDSLLLKLTGSPKECDKGEIVRARQAISLATNVPVNS